MSLFLSNAELQELTGYKLASKQTRWLQCHGYYVETNARGIPRITHIQVEEMRRNNTPASFFNVSNSVQNSAHKQSISVSTEPDFNSLRNKINKLSING